jgi:hypothetical protein
MKFFKLVLCFISPLFLTACFDSPEVKKVKTGVLIKWCEALWGHHLGNLEKAKTESTL